MQDKIEAALATAGIAYKHSCVCSPVEYVCSGTTPEKVNEVLKSVNAFDDFRAGWDDDSIWNRNKTVYVYRLFRNGKSWD